MSRNIFRATVTAAKDKMMRALQVLIRGEETRDNLEHMEPYGFTSEPFTDGATDALVVFLDDDKAHGIVVNVADRRYRIQSLEQGEVCIYDDKGHKIHLKRSELLIDGASDPVNVTTSGDITATAGGDITLTASGTITMNASTVQINAPVSSTAGITASGDVVGGSISLDTHTHSGVQSGSSNTGTPNS